MWKNSLKTKLVVSFALISLVAITIAGASALISMRKTTEQEIQDKLLLLADAKEGQVFAYLDSLESRTLDFSSDGFIRDNVNNVEALNEHLINNKKPLDKNIFCIMVLDSAGKVVSSVFKEEIGNDESKTVQFIEGKKGIFAGEEVGEAESESEKALISVSAPIIDNDTGKLLGVIVNSFTMNKLDEILSGEFQIQKGALSAQQGFAQTLAIHLVDKEKKILAHGHKETGHKVNTIDTLPVQKCLSDKEEIVGTYTNHFGEEVIGASMCFPQRGWILLTEINTDEALAPVMSTTYGLAIMLVLVLIFVILDIFLIAGRIIEPIKKLHEASDIIAGGNLDYKVDIKTGDEVGQLANAFNKMTANLKKSHFELRQYSESLEEKVTEKTKDLQDKVDDLNKTREAVLNVAEDAEEEKQRTVREKNKIDAILHSIGDGVFVVDKNLKVILVNEVAAKMAGYKAEEILGTKYSEKLKFIFEDTGKINDQFINKAIETKIIQAMANHTVLVDKAGNKIQVADSAAPLLDKNSEVIGCVAVFRDVTKERSIDKAKTEFVSLASHQLRTPLSTINWYSEMLLSGDAGEINENQKKYLEETYKASKRMVALVNSLLNVSRIELGTFAIDPKPIDPIKIAKICVKDLKPQIKAKRLVLKEKYASDDLTLPADPKLLGIIFQNLLSNAVKYTPDGGSIKLSMSKVRDRLSIVIEDTGMGIPESQKDRIFEKLFRADNVREVDAEGTGLGLYLVKAIVMHAGGQIRFESKEGKGTTFYVTLPLSGMSRKEGTKELS